MSKQCKLKAGDKVRHKQTGRKGFVVAVADAAATSGHEVWVESYDDRSKSGWYHEVQWERVDMSESCKFKVGDRVRHKQTGETGRVCLVQGDVKRLITISTHAGYHLCREGEKGYDEWEHVTMSESDKANTTDKVNPSHYHLKPEPIEVIRGWGLGFCVGNAIKYLARAGHKPGETELDDIRKAKRYLELRIEELEGKEAK